MFDQKGPPAWDVYQPRKSDTVHDEGGGVVEEFKGIWGGKAVIWEAEEAGEALDEETEGEDEEERGGGEDGVESDWF